MHEPTPASYRHAKLALMHVHKYPVSPRFAPKKCTSLILAEPTIVPFATEGKEYGLHMLVDSNKEAPRCTSGVDIMLGGAVIDTSSVRQHHVSPDVHAGEVNAACYAVGKLIPIRGLLHELGIVQIRPTPVYFDSASTIFVVRNMMSARRSAWLLGKLAFVHEAVANDEIDALKIDTAKNTADGKTKYIAASSYWLHLTYTHNVSYQTLKTTFGVHVPLANTTAEYVCALLTT